MVVMVVIVCDIVDAVGDVVVVGSTGTVVDGSLVIVGVIVMMIVLLVVVVIGWLVLW